MAFFADSFHEVNGLALTARALDDFARRRRLPWLCVRGARRTRDPGELHEGLDLARSRLSIPLDPDLSFDPLWPRHVARAARALDRLAPDVIHITGVNDMSQLGAWLAWRRRVPVVASWHTNVHEFAARRLRTALGTLPPRLAAGIPDRIGRAIWRAVLRFYRIPRAILAPNAALIERLTAETGRPAFLMRRGVDAGFFTPANRGADDGMFRIGYVGRLAPEKNVRMLAGIERRLLELGASNFSFLVVGDGSERAWLEHSMQRAVFTGVLRGQALAAAYARMDLFIFPSETDSFGNVVLEALASGVPCIVTPRGGPRSIVEPGRTGIVAENEAAFAEAAHQLMQDRQRLDAMRRAARAQVVATSWDAIFEEVYAVYGSIGRPGSPADGRAGRPGAPRQEEDRLAAVRARTR